MRDLTSQHVSVLQAARGAEGILIQVGKKPGTFKRVLSGSGPVRDSSGQITHLEFHSVGFGEAESGPGIRTVVKDLIKSRFLAPDPSFGTYVHRSPEGEKQRFRALSVTTDGLLALMWALSQDPSGFGPAPFAITSQIDIPVNRLYANYDIVTNALVYERSLLAFDGRYEMNGMPIHERWAAMITDPDHGIMHFVEEARVAATAPDAVGEGGEPTPEALAAYNRACEPLAAVLLHGLPDIGEFVVLHLQDVDTAKEAYFVLEESYADELIEHFA